MNTVILAAGEGNRMRPLTYTRPKVMLPIANKPILEHLLISVREAGLEDFIFVVGYHDEQVRDYFGNGERWGVHIQYATQRRQMGTADALKAIEGLVNGNFLVINGDIIVDQGDIDRLKEQKCCTISTIKVDQTEGLGTVDLEMDRVVRIHEKVDSHTSRLANAGLYLFTPQIFDAITQTLKSPRGEYEITDSLQWTIDKGYPVSHYQLSYWLNLSYPWDLLTANESLLTRIVPQNVGEIEDNVVMKGAVTIDRGTTVRSGSYIVGPVSIGRDCEIGPNCYIRPHSAIGDNCHIGSAVEVKNSIIMSGSKIPHHNYIGDSIIGAGCNFGAGTKIANLRFDKSDIIVGDIDTKRHKLGAIIGDRVETGINASINVGSVIGNNTHVGPGATVNGTVSPDSKVF